MWPAPRYLVGAVGAALVVLVVLPPTCQYAGDGAVAILGPGLLPREVHACEREYNRGDPVVVTSAHLEAAYEADPPIVSAWTDNSCHDRACPDPCPTVVFVKAGPDAFVRYGLVGGP
jgi:hypothetical protein